MPFQVRRVVTGHNEAGRSVVLADGPTPIERRWAGSANASHWMTMGFPVDNTEQVDGAPPAQLSWSEGSAFTTASFDANSSGEMHRTDSLDYAIVLSGAIDMEVDEGAVHLEAGDVLIQRGTAHAWSNRGTEPCVVAFVMIGARPLD